MPSARTVPETPLFRQSVDRIMKTFDRAGFEIDMGAKLYGTYLEAGLPEPQMISSARTEGGAATFAYEYIAQTIGSLMPVMEKTGVASASDVGVDNLADRLRAEAIAHNSCILLPQLTGAWARVPG